MMVSQGSSSRQRLQSMHMTESLHPTGTGIRIPPPRTIPAVTAHNEVPSFVLIVRRR